jgi:predicted kinase
MEAIILIGVQASGKSTFYKQRFVDSHLRINLDMLKTRYREEILLRACLEAKQPFVVDNTNTLTRQRARYIEAAREARFRVIGYYFRSSIGDALRRNRQRAAEQVVPDKGISGTYYQLNVPVLAEGFDELYYVTVKENFEFEVQEWRDDLVSPASP